MVTPTSRQTEKSEHEELRRGISPESQETRATPIPERMAFTTPTLASKHIEGEDEGGHRQAEEHR